MARKKRPKPGRWVMPEPEPRPELKLRRVYVFDYCGRALTGKLKQKSQGGWVTMETETETFRVRSTAVRRLARLP